MSGELVMCEPRSQNFRDPASSLTFGETTEDYKIFVQLKCRRDEVAVEVEGKNVVRITTSERGGTVHEVLMSRDVKLEQTTAAFDGGTLTITVPKRAGWFAGSSLLWRGLKRTSISIA